MSRSKRPKSKKSPKRYHQRERSRLWRDVGSKLPETGLDVPPAEGIPLRRGGPSNGTQQRRATKAARATDTRRLP